ncbi:GIY-YIG nuclease family protein [uncultured Mailhella sp.]|uniref:GIY-YIG nuclease family protein n=1 Tax=uncultured Mailhella sp. TaxID=1981031 RepID=UPI002605346C|nr:GIY-YIG nuclease family protein [uncultured Mailhella sp.]
MLALPFFPQRTTSHPKIYAYEFVGVASHKGYIKIGYTERDVETRVKEQVRTAAVPYKILGHWSAMKNDGSCFTDHDVHAFLKARGKARLNAGEDRNEWFKCSLKDVEAAIVAIKTGTENVESRTRTFAMRPEQALAVERTVKYFASVYQENSGRTPKFLWNAKMRFGKTFASYQLARRMGFKRVLILTFKPAVQTAWREDLLSHIDFEGWQFITRPAVPGGLSTDAQFQRADKSRPIVCFGSFQDFLGINKETGGIKANNEWVHTTSWDLVIFDEYHFGAWKDSAKKLFEQDEDSYDDDPSPYDNTGNTYDETWLPITATYYLYLSGTPFRALNSGEFIEEQVYNWTYSDEQKAKAEWPNLSAFPDYRPKPGDINPYAALPRMVLMTYKIPENIQYVAKQGEFDEFDLNAFFSAEKDEKGCRFKYENEVQKWLDLIRGAYLETTVDELKLGAQKPPMPYSDTRLLNVLSHTLWFLPNVASCHAMANLLAQRQNTFFHDYRINVCAGAQAGIGAAALEPVLRSMDDPLETRTITLSCGKLTTGVTIRPWTGIFMLRNLTSPETYFQAAFRVQSPWEIKKDNGEQEIIKQECYVFDFALERALRQISDYSCRLNVAERNPEKKVEEITRFLPVLAYDGSSMRQVNAAEILDIAMSGTTATLLAKRWESALLVNVDNETLARLLANEEAMAALMRIEGFRSLNSDIETIINKSNAVKKAKRDGEELPPKERKELTEAEKEYKSKRKLIQQKLIKFATRVPVFMYLTDYREYSLRDVITQLEPELFKKVTGLNVKDFELLVSLNVFNEALMNDAVYKFKRYEDASLVYTGIDKHSGENVGLYSTVVSREDYDAMAGQLASSMQAASPEDSDFPEEPVFANMAGSLDTDEDEDDVPPAAEQKVKLHAKRKAAAQNTTPPSGSTYRPAYVPPAPEPAPIPKKPRIKADTSSVHAGTIVTHKAFGTGRVKGIDGGVIIVVFGGVDRKFQFPGAFEQGFLELPEAER